MPKGIGYSGVQKDEAGAKSGKPQKMPVTKKGSGVQLTGGKPSGGKKGYGLR